jgi:aminoglycoside phosphotransferase (APT) family kinase protein
VENKFLPQSENIQEIIRQNFKENALKIDRFPMGNCHFVFDVITESGKNLVARIARPENKNLLENAIFWNGLLKPKGVPLPEILAFELNSTNFPYLILERLKGTDLNEVYPQLSKLEKNLLATELVKVQNNVRTLPPAKGFGFLGNYETDSYCRTWSEVLRNSLARSRNRMKSGGVFETKVLDRVEERFYKFEDYLSQIRPVAFLDDITTKNVIVHNGKLSGIVDVDWVCFGDSLLTVALARMSLLLSNYDLDYIEFWCNEINLKVEQKQILDFYTALFCVDFMGEIGQVFNKEKPLKIDSEKHRKLHSILVNLLDSI